MIAQYSYSAATHLQGIVSIFDYTYPPKESILGIDIGYCAH